MTLLKGDVAVVSFSPGIGALVFASHGPDGNIIGRLNGGDVCLCLDDPNGDHWAKVLSRIGIGYVTVFALLKEKDT